jgi:hypothetical protein
MSINVRKEISQLASIDIEDFDYCSETCTYLEYFPKLKDNSYAKCLLFIDICYGNNNGFKRCFKCKKEFSNEYIKEEGTIF